ncbi:hypothetical protein VTO42DRAFT_3702 [Malbranchea cinnamomea]
MQNGSPNGRSQHHDNVDSERKDVTAKQDDDPPQGPPPKKRRIGNSSGRSTPRPPSPPWKKVGVDGPTSFFIEGKRRSARTNALPLELQPPSDKRHTRSAQKEYVDKAKSSRAPWSENPSPTPASTCRDTNGRRSGGKVLTGGVEASWRTTGKVTSAKQVTLASASPKSSHTKARTDITSSPTTRLRNSISNSRGRRRVSMSSTALNGLSVNLDRHPGDSIADNEAATDDVKDSNLNQKLPKLRFKVRIPSVGVQHPLHVLPPKRYASFRDWFENEAVENGDLSFTTEESALREALLRDRIRKAGEPGGLLSREKCSYYMTGPEEEPPKQYSHRDHFLAHIQYFHKLLEIERKRHRHQAKVLAHACAEEWRKIHKRPEDILKQQQEEVRQKHRQLVKDLQKQFDLVRAEIEKRKLARWEEQKRVEDQLALNKAIRQSTMLFEKRRVERADDFAESEEQFDGEGESTSDDGTPLSESENESNMSTNDSESEEEDSGQSDDDDSRLTAEQLRLKYAHLTSSNTPSAEHYGEGRDANTRTAFENKDDRMESKSIFPDPPEGYGIELDEVDPLLMDDSDDSTDMEDDMGDSDEEMGSNDEESSSDDGPGLLGFFSAQDLANLQVGDLTKEKSPTPSSKSMKVDDESEEEDDNDEVLLVPNGSPERFADSGWGGIHDATDHLAKSPPSPIQTNGESETELHSNVEHAEAASSQPVEYQDDRKQHRKLTELPSPAESTDPATQTTPAEASTTVEERIKDAKSSEFADYSSVEGKNTSLPLKTPIPHLLRGTLREYQHYGLDWLAGLYASNINGILADEMGLGKTIQTIALLAHLAVEHQVWGPHLVVVPTSVMLNWEMEFKKWCPGFKILTYYGTQEERKQKRKGWMDDERWNVCITSYQLVLQDQQIFKRRNWHYMILDEAHNIKNFRSQRWQTLLTFKTQARLLLTGTPLQNNLTELWSLLFFLMPSDEDGTGVEGFADLRDFSEWFRRPVEQILEHGRDIMDDEAKKVVAKLHTVLRPYILRRLKADVEKQMPAKFEHVVPCRLSKRQRYLYDGFMSRAQTKETLASGNYLSIINCLMQLRKVCNHPDLFETRPITTSFAMPKSVLADFEIKDLLVRRRLLQEDPLTKVDLDFLNLAPVSREESSKTIVDDSIRIMAYNPLRLLRERQYNRTNWNMGFDGSSVQSTLMSMDNSARKSRMAELERCLYFESKRHGRRPVYGTSLIELLSSPTVIQRQFRPPSHRRDLLHWLSSQSPALNSMVMSIEDRSRVVEPLIQKFACITPAVVARDVTEAALTPIKSYHFTPEQRVPAYDPFHEAQTRLSIAFPDKRLLQYDCGKLQQLDKLLRKLQAEGHRALIFTQMTKMLDILEQFLNIHGHRYLRLDGATKIEQRQILTERFNNDTRILVFILSSRSGGLGINLTGADTVIFYDLDWNPAMDKQCQDRCHRIGQTRDVHIYRFVSEYTIESNILRKANQKRMLDDVVIQEGDFTTDYFQKLDVRDMLSDDLIESRDEAAAAMDRVLDTRTRGTSRVFEQVEDKEDIDAAKTAEKELEHVDDADFGEGSVSQTPGPNTPGHPGASEFDTPRMTEVGDDAPFARKPDEETPEHIESPATAAPEVDEPQVGHIDDYLLRFMEWYLKDEPLALLPEKSKKSKRGKEHRFRRHR